MDTQSCNCVQIDNPVGNSSPSDSDDNEMEAELIETVKARDKDDPLAAYDLDVAEDGEAIQMYLSLLESGRVVQPRSSA